MIEKTDQIRNLLIVPSVDEQPKIAINQMKILNLLVELRAEAEQCNIAHVSKRNWFERLPLHWRYVYYMVGGIVIGYLLHYVC